MAKTTDLEFELRMCGKKVYVTYYEQWDRLGFDERPIRQKMKQMVRTMTVSRCVFKQPGESQKADFKLNR